MPTLPSDYLSLMRLFAPHFSKCVWQHAQVLLLGAILVPGRRTVTAVLRTLAPAASAGVMGLSAERQFQTYHRVLNRAVWSSWALSRTLLKVLVQTFVPTGPIICGLDDTIERRRGPQTPALASGASVKARGIYRDPVRSSQGHFVKVGGLRWLSLMLLAPIPWAKRTWALPFLTCLALSARFYEKKARAHKTLTDWGRQMVAARSAAGPTLVDPAGRTGLYSTSELVARAAGLLGKRCRMIRLQSMVGLSERAVTAVVLGANLLAAYALVAFGWRAGGFALNGPASYTYLVLVVAAALAFVVTLGRDDEWVRAARVVVGPALALIVIGAWTATSTAGAKYADWAAVSGDQLPVEALWQVGYAGLGSILALALRWPRLLLVWALTHALIFVGGLAVFGQWAFLILRVNPGEALPLLLAPLAYALAGLALGWRPGQPALTTARRSPAVTLSWAAVAPAAWFTLAAAQRWLSATVLPQAGQSQGWYTPAQSVPLNAWSPTLAWARELFALVPYLVVAVVALGLVASWPALRRIRFGATTLMVGLGLAVLTSVKLSATPPLLYILASVDAEGGWLARLFGIALPLERLLLLVVIGFGLLLVADLGDADIHRAHAGRVFPAPDLIEQLLA